MRVAMNEKMLSECTGDLPAECTAQPQTPLASLAPLTLAHRLCIFNKSNLDPNAVCAMDDAAITATTMIAADVPFLNLRASGLTPSALLARGFKTPSEYRLLGMDTMDLVDVTWTRELAHVHGVAAVRNEFLVNPIDMAVMAGTDAAKVLGLTLDSMLQACAGEPYWASCVLKRELEVPYVDVVSLLATTSLRRLMDTGLRCEGIAECGVPLQCFAELERAHGSSWEGATRHFC